MKLTVLVLILALACALAAAAHGAPPDPFKQLGKPTHVSKTTMYGARWLCQTWALPARGFVAQRCFYLGAAAKKAKPAKPANPALTG